MDKWLEIFARTNFRRSSDTAHDLKTPLNVAVLNLELLRMRMRKLSESSEDPRLNDYAAAIETEMRRMARIFDNFFLLSTPPKGEPAPSIVELSTILLQEAAEQGGITVAPLPPLPLLCHEVRIRQALRLFLDASATLMPAGSCRVDPAPSGQVPGVWLTGQRPEGEFEPTKLFKFYYTDSSGNPDLSFATARLIFETYGAELNAVEESDKVVIKLLLPGE